MRLKLILEALGNDVVQIFTADVHAKVVRCEQPSQLLGYVALLGRRQIAESVLYPLLLILRMIRQRKRNAVLIAVPAATGV